jgi:Cu-processing system permease protein
MSDEAIHVEVTASAPEPTAGGRRAFDRAVADQSLVRLRGGPSAFRTTLLMADITFREAARRKILWIATLAGVAFLTLFWAGLHAVLKHQAHARATVDLREGIGMMTMMVLYAGSMMTSLMAALTSCETLSGEITSGTIHAIATKPVLRWSLVLGKWTGFAWMITLYVLLIEGGSLMISRLESGFLPRHGAAVLGLIWLQAIVLLGVTMAASTRFSALTSGAISLGLYGLAFVGGWIEQFGSLRHVQACIDLGIVSSLIMPTDALWRRAAFRFQPPLIGAAGVGPFSGTLMPSNAMVIYAVLYAVLALLLAQVLFSRRDL